LLERINLNLPVAGDYQARTFNYFLHNFIPDSIPDPIPDPSCQEDITL
jgi:hypothetical protein